MAGGCVEGRRGPEGGIAAKLLQQWGYSVLTCRAGGRGHRGEVDLLANAAGGFLGFSHLARPRRSHRKNSQEVLPAQECFDRAHIVVRINDMSFENSINMARFVFMRPQRGSVLLSGYVKMVLIRHLHRWYISRGTFVLVPFLYCVSVLFSPAQKNLKKNIVK